MRGIFLGTLGHARYRYEKSRACECAPRAYDSCETLSHGPVNLRLRLCILVQYYARIVKLLLDFLSRRCIPRCYKFRNSKSIAETPKSNVVFLGSLSLSLFFLFGELSDWLPRWRLHSPHEISSSSLLSPIFEHADDDSKYITDRRQRRRRWKGSSRLRGPSWLSLVCMFAKEQRD